MLKTLLRYNRSLQKGRDSFVYKEKIQKNGKNFEIS